MDWIFCARCEEEFMANLWPAAGERPLCRKCQNDLKVRPSVAQADR